MLKITVELLPHGDKSRAEVLGVCLIANNVARSIETQGREGDYEVTLSKFGGRGIWKQGQVEHFPRKQLGPWDLLYRALEVTVGYRNRKLSVPRGVSVPRRRPDRHAPLSDLSGDGGSGGGPNAAVQHRREGSGTPGADAC